MAASSKTSNKRTVTDGGTEQSTREQIETLITKKHEEETKIRAARGDVKTGRGGTANFPSSRDRYKDKPDAVKKALRETLAAYKMPRVRSDEELVERVSEYFDLCATTGQIPTVEEMALTCGYGVHEWLDIVSGRRRGFSEETATVIKKAKSFLAAFDAKMAVTGEINFLAYCFRAKNYYGMADKQEVVLTPNNPLGDAAGQKQLADKYLDLVDVGED